MKSMAVVLLVALAAFGVVAVADAQSGKSPAGTQAPATQAPSSGQINPERPDDTQAPGRDVNRSDDGSALPRSAATERTTIFGLSPTAAVVIAAALLVVVILAIIAMTRSGETYIDTNRRL
jgi:hypothetical protein